MSLITAPLSIEPDTFLQPLSRNDKKEYVKRTKKHALKQSLRVQLQISRRKNAKLRIRIAELEAKLHTLEVKKHVKKATTLCEVCHKYKKNIALHYSYHPEHELQAVSPILGKPS